MEAQIKQLMEMHSEQKKAVERINEGMKLIETIQASLERWKLINGYDNYSVSTYGRVRNDKTGKLLKCDMCRQGYYGARLWKNGKCKKMRIHRLVAIAFIPNPDNKRCVDHIDNNRLNNKLSNLRYATHQENQYNRKMNKSNTSGCKGVYFDKKAKKWRAQIKIDGICIFLGRFDNIEDAKNARIDKANEAFGTYINACEK